MEKRNLHTIEDKIVLDLYSCLSANSNDKYYFAGGLSLQFFLPIELHRKSSDVDTNGVSRLNYSGFKDIFSKSLDDLVDLGYNYKFQKQSSTFDAVVDNSTDKVIVQYPRKSNSGYERLKRIGERESSNSQVVKYNDLKLKVIPTEDVVVHKYIRMNKFVDKYNLVMPRTKNFFEMRKKINGLKDDMVLNNFNFKPEEMYTQVAKIRLLADVFDVTAISVYKGLDKNYLFEAMNDYDSLKDKKSEIENYLCSINPNVFKGC